MLDRQWAQAFAQEWIEAWNSHDLERIFSHYAEDFEMSSPLIVERLKIDSGVLKGKTAIRPYWEIGLAASPPLHFELIDVFVGVNSIVIHYRRQSGKLAAETLIFNEQGQVIKGIAHYGS